MQCALGNGWVSVNSGAEKHGSVSEPLQFRRRLRVQENESHARLCMSRQTSSHTQTLVLFHVCKQPAILAILHCVCGFVCVRACCVQNLDVGEVKLTQNRGCTHSDFDPHTLPGIRRLSSPGLGHDCAVASPIKPASAASAVVVVVTPIAVCQPCAELCKFWSVKAGKSPIPLFFQTELLHVLISHINTSFRISPSSSTGHNSKQRPY